MDSVNKTLYIPLYGKSYVSRLGIILDDRYAERIWESEGFALGRKSRSRWLAYYMGMRSRVFDDIVREKIDAGYDTVIHLGCGLDSRAFRIEREAALWYDVDFPSVISERQKHFDESAGYKMVDGDIRTLDFLERIPKSPRAVIIMEGVAMYLTTEEINALCDALGHHFGEYSLIIDVYSRFAAKMSRYKNPVKEVGVSQVYGIDSPSELLFGGLSFIKEWEMTPSSLIEQLPRSDRFIFKRLYAGSTAKSLYKLYEYRGTKK